MTHDTLVILGSGYTGRYLFPLASRRYGHILASSRDPDQHLREVPPGHRIQFDLARPDTWKNIPETADLLWCFPAAPLELVQSFSTTVNLVTHRLVVLASTSAYDVGDSHESPPPWITETAPMDLQRSRVQGEEHLRTRYKAIVLRVAGIYGPHRNPLDWISTGRVGPSGKYVNLIHVEDLAAICLAALERGTAGDSYNVSDGTPRTWKDICDVAHARWGLQAPIATICHDLGKRISNTKLTEELGYTIQHPDLYRELDRLSV